MRTAVKKIVQNVMEVIHDHEENYKKRTNAETCIT